MLTQKGQEFIDNYKKYGSGLTGIQYAKRTRLSPTTYYKWRRDSEFLQCIEELEKINSEPDKTLTSLTWISTSGLEDWQIKFLDHYKKSTDHLASLDVAKVSLGMLKDGLRKNKKFASVYRELEEEITIACRDVLKQKAIYGKSITAASKVLEATDPAFQKKVAVAHTHTVGTIGDGSWGNYFGVLEPAKEDVVDVEVVSKPD